jgi:LAO/AO transport system kinase
MEMVEVLAGVRARNRRAVGRAISLIESRGDAGREVARQLHPHTGRARRIGITGSPGVGKSTIVSALIGHLRAQGQTVAVVSVDPTSPFTRGAVLGDRIRLVDHFTDPDVFIRSMASRGHLGGLAEATAGAVLVLDAAGFDVVLVETVGTGQNEVEVQALTETVVLALMPGSGDSIQAIKAGLMEIPDVLVVNKADRPGADLLRAELEATLSLVPAGPWTPPIVMTRAHESAGIPELWDAVNAHGAHLDEPGRRDARRADGMRRQLRALALDRLGRELDAACPDHAVAALAAQVLDREIDPDSAVDAMVSRRGDTSTRS